MPAWPLEWKHAGIAAATVASEFINGVWMPFVVHRRPGSIGWGRIGRSVARIVLASAGMGLAASSVTRAPALWLASADTGLFLTRPVSVAAVFKSDPPLKNFPGKSA